MCAAPAGRSASPAGPASLAHGISHAERARAPHRTSAHASHRLRTPKSAHSRAMGLAPSSAVCASNASTAPRRTYIGLEAALADLPCLQPSVCRHYGMQRGLAPSARPAPAPVGRTSCAATAGRRKAALAITPATSPR